MLRNVSLCASLVFWALCEGLFNLTDELNQGVDTAGQKVGFGNRQLLETALDHFPLNDCQIRDNFIQPNNPLADIIAREFNRCGR
jgi:hypothetical protein